MLVNTLSPPFDSGLLISRLLNQGRTMRRTYSRQGLPSTTCNVGGMLAMLAAQSFLETPFPTDACFAFPSALCTPLWQLTALYIYGNHMTQKYMLHTVHKVYHCP